MSFIKRIMIPSEIFPMEVLVGNDQPFTFTFKLVIVKACFSDLEPFFVIIFLKSLQFFVIDFKA